MSRIDLRLLFGDRVLEWLLVQLGEKLAIADTIVVIDQHAGDLAADARRHEGDMAVHIGVIRRDGVQGQVQPGNPVDPKRRTGQGDRNGQQQRTFPFSPMGRRLLFGRRLARRRLARLLHRVGFLDRSNLAPGHVVAMRALLFNHSGSSSQCGGGERGLCA